MLKLFTAAVLDSPGDGPAPDAEAGSAVVITPDGPKPKTLPEHAFDREATLCGIPASKLLVMDRHWSPRTKPSCSVCRAMFETTYAPDGIPDDYPYGRPAN
jgi:hypothetical protein